MISVNLIGQIEAQSPRTFELIGNKRLICSRSCGTGWGWTQEGTGIARRLRVRATYKDGGQEGLVPICCDGGAPRQLDGRARVCTIISRATGITIQE